MALFSTRAQSASSSSSNKSATVLTNEEFKRRAKNRLIGSFVLVVLGVLGFTWLLDTQPRTAVNDVPVVIPPKDNAGAWKEPVAPQSPVTSAATSTSSKPGSASIASLKPSSSPDLSSISNLPASSSATSKVVASAEANKTAENAAATKTASSSGSKFAQAANTALSAKEKEKRQEQEALRKKEELFSNAAKLASNTKPTSANVETGQFVIQVGAYADANKAREIKAQLVSAGLKAYTQNVNSAGASLVRVRVGPYSSKAAAEKNVNQIKALNLSAIVTNQ